MRITVVHAHVWGCLILVTKTRIVAVDGRARKHTLQMEREQIITQILLDHQRTSAAEVERTTGLTEEQGHPALDDLLQRSQSYSSVIVEELERRLTEHQYLTCVDFDHFDVNCCANCHTGYPHYDMYDVTLDDGRHAWVCCPIRHILMREVRMIGGPVAEERLKLLQDIFGCPPDPVEEKLHLANLAAKTDEERLSYCLMSAHHVYGRRRGHNNIDALVSRALRLPGRGPARGCQLSGNRLQ